MAKSKSTTQAKTAVSQNPTVTIYQNGEYVAGVVQQHFNRPLVVDEVLENEGSSSEEKKRQHDFAGDLTGEGQVPWAAKAGLDVRYAHARGASDVVATSTRATQNFVYSQAYYLNLIRTALRESGQLRNVADLADAEALVAGTFVEYEAKFHPSELTTIMDVVTPELVQTITRNRHLLANAQRFEGYASFEATQQAALKAQVEADARGEIAGEITRAVKADFRSSTTREYYGVIGAGENMVTAITICDNMHFTVEDEDRILDGRFTVLGKVSSTPESDVPLLERNKLLSRIRPDGVDELSRFLDEQIGDLDSDQNPLNSEHLDLGFNSRVDGTSFRVIPIAIYL